MIVSSQPEIILYSRHGCHLCDDAAAILARHGLAFRTFDIDSDPEIRERFHLCIPVVEIDGRVRFKGRISEPLLKRLLADRSGS